jgi:hypothetical protein
MKMVFPIRLLRRVAEEAFCRWIPAFDRSVDADRIDGVGRGVDDRFVQDAERLAAEVGHDEAIQVLALDNQRR